MTEEGKETAATTREHDRVILSYSLTVGARIVLDNCYTIQIEWTERVVLHVHRGRKGSV